MNKELFRYIDGQMNDREKMGFEEKLKTDLSLKRDYEKATAGLELIKDYGKPNEINGAYFNNITVHFRENLAKEKKPKLFFLSKYAVAVPAMLLCFLFSIVFFNKNAEKKITINKTYENYNDKEKKEFLLEAANNVEINEDFIEEVDAHKELPIEKNISDELNAEK